VWPRPARTHRGSGSARPRSGGVGSCVRGGRLVHPGHQALRAALHAAERIVAGNRRVCPNLETWDMLPSARVTDPFAQFSRLGSREETGRVPRRRAGVNRTPRWENRGAVRAGHVPKMSAFEIGHTRLFPATIRSGGVKGRRKCLVSGVDEHDHPGTTPERPPTRTSGTRPRWVRAGARPHGITHHP